ncbi:MAG: DEAD/DEAH box helicase [Acidobacteria bacterium]|nr:DEAD/DEAH box helicase [Acidobacteriota bacterium]
MRNLLENLRNAPTPLIVKSKAGIIKAVKDVHLTVLKAALKLEDSIDVTNKVASLRRYALFLEDVAFEELAEGEEQESLFSAAASLYEFTGSLSTNRDTYNIFQPPLNDFLRSAILSSFTPYQAHSSLIGRRIREKIQDDTTLPPDLRCHLIVAATIAALIGRDLQATFASSQKLNPLQKLAVETLKARDATNQEILTLDRAIAIGRVCGKVALGMLIGIERLTEGAAERLNLINLKAEKVRDANHYWLADRLSSLVNNMAKANIHKPLKAAIFPERYRLLLARDKYLEFWGPQLQAIEKGLLDAKSLKHFVISIPTGSGKSLFAELSILTALRGTNSGWAVYVTPSRALVNQVSSDLRHRLEPCGFRIRTIVAGAEQSELLDEELDLLQMNRTVTVTTPEKLDAYYRNAQEIFATCRLVIFDEMHKIAEKDRGPLIESLVARFLSIHPQTRIIFLSGVMSNVDEMKSWLGESDTAIISERSRPTRRVYGVAVRGQEHPQSKTRNSSKSKKSLRRVDFSGGLVVVHEHEDLEESFEIALPNMFRGFYTERIFPKSTREDRQERHSSAIDHAIDLAQSIAKAPGTILVFMEKIQSVQRGCKEFKYNDPIFSKERLELAAHISNELGPNHPLAGYCKRGVAYHHSRLPINVQRAIELALEGGWLKVVFATATLREGLNTAATTVIMAGHMLFDKSTNRGIDIPESDFMNIAGRAGRPRTDTEGRIFLIPNSLSQSAAIENGKKYILAGDAALRVKSQLTDLANALSRLEGAMIDLPTNHQATLLGLEAATLADSDGIATFLNHSLWAIQEDDENFSKETAKRMFNVLAKAKADIGVDNVKSASRLGLSLSSSESLRVFLTEKKDLFTDNDSEIERKTAQISTLLEASLKLPEICNGVLKNNVDPSAHVGPLLEWINGANYQAISNVSLASGVFEKTEDVTEAVKYCSDISTWLSWSFGSAHSLLRTIISNVDPYIGILPLLVKYGVPTTTAAYLSLLGVSDRNLAQNLAKQYEATSRPIKLQEVSQWLESIDIDDIEGILAAQENNIRKELVRRQVARGRSSHTPYHIARIKVFNGISAGTLLSIQEDQGVLLLMQDNLTIGELSAPEDISWFYRRQKLMEKTLFSQEEKMPQVAVVVSDTQAGRIGTIALIESGSIT